MLPFTALTALSPLLVAAAPAPGRTCVVAAAGAAAAADAARAEIERVLGAPILPAPAIELEAIQLALGCVGEAPACAAALARQLGADTLVIARVSGTPAGREVSLERLDGGSGARVGAARARETPERSLAAAAAEAAASLFEWPARPAAPAVAAAPAAPTPAAAAPTPAAAAPSVYPLATAGAGVLALGIGAVLGAASAAGQDAYATHPITSRADVDDALDTLDGARGQATAANVLFAVGGALVAGGAAWLAVELVDP